MQGSEGRRRDAAITARDRAYRHVNGLKRRVSLARDGYASLATTRRAAETGAVFAQPDLTAGPRVRWRTGWTRCTVRATVIRERIRTVGSRSVQRATTIDELLAADLVAARLPDGVGARSRARAAPRRAHEGVRLARPGAQRVGTPRAAFSDTSEVTL
jgi:hypothetical protein